MHVLRLAVPVHHEAPIGLLHVHLLNFSSSETGVIYRGATGTPCSEVNVCVDT